MPVDFVVVDVGKKHAVAIFDRIAGHTLRGPTTGQTHLFARDVAKAFASSLNSRPGCGAMARGPDNIVAPGPVWATSRPPVVHRLVKPLPEQTVRYDALARRAERPKPRTNPKGSAGKRKWLGTRAVDFRLRRKNGRPHLWAPTDTGKTMVASGRYTKVGKKHYRRIDGATIQYDHNAWLWVATDARGRRIGGWTTLYNAHHFLEKEPEERSIAVERFPAPGAKPRRLNASKARISAMSAADYYEARERAGIAQDKAADKMHTTRNRLEVLYAEAKRAGAPVPAALQERIEVARDKAYKAQKAWERAANERTKYRA